MGRPLREQMAGGIYHITTRGNRKGSIYLDDQDRRWFLTSLANVADRFELVVHAYCLMTTHYHLVVTTTHPNLSAAMQVLNTRYAHAFNWKYGTDGHVFARRFGSSKIVTDAHLLECARYVVLNPVRARICESAADWPWSSYRAMFSDVPHPFLRRDWLLGQFASDVANARERYREFVDAGIRR